MLSCKKKRKKSLYTPCVFLASYNPDSSVLHDSNLIAVCLTSCLDRLQHEKQLGHRKSNAGRGGMREINRRAYRGQAKDGGKSERGEQKSWKRNGSAFPMFQLLLLAQPPPRWQDWAVREVNLLYSGRGVDERGGWNENARWKFTFPSVPLLASRIVTRSGAYVRSALEITAGTGKSERAKAEQERKARANRLREATVPRIIIIDHKLRAACGSSAVSSVSRCQSAGIFITARANLRRNYRQFARGENRGCYRLEIFQPVAEWRKETFGRVNVCARSSEAGDDVASAAFHQRAFAKK